MNDGEPETGGEAGQEPAGGTGLEGPTAKQEGSAEQGGTSLQGEAEQGGTSLPGGVEHSPQELSRALQAFKKRLKLTRLDHESKLGYGPMTGGRPSAIVAITPPNQYPRSVWDALVAQGRLKKGQQGMYELA